MLEQTSLFDLSQYDRPESDRPLSNRKVNRKIPVPETKTRNLVNFKRLSLGSSVRKGGRVGVVECKHFARPLSIWVRWQVHPWETSPYESLPTPEVADTLEMIAYPPKPRLPADISSLTSDTQIKSVSEELTRSISLPHQPHVNEYYPGGTGKMSGPYFRITWRPHLGKPRHRHIRGGNIKSSFAKARAQRVRDAIARGDSLEEILALC